MTKSGRGQLAPVPSLEGRGRGEESNLDHRPHQAQVEAHRRLSTLAPAQEPGKLHSVWFSSASSAVSVRLHLGESASRLRCAPPEAVMAEDLATLEAACRLMPSLDCDLIARALELGPHRPSDASP